SCSRARLAKAELRKAERTMKKGSERCCASPRTSIGAMPHSSTKANRVFFKPVATLSGFNDRPLINKVVLGRECPKYLQQEAGLMKIVGLCLRCGEGDR